jgi:hypothetical protein
MMEHLMLYHHRMRTTLSLDDDVLAAARELAEYQGSSIGAVISDLSRRGLEAARAGVQRTGRVPTFAPRPGAKAITMESVRQALDDE